MDLVADNSSALVLVLRGEGGTGKTVLACSVMEYARSINYSIVSSRADDTGTARRKEKQRKLIVRTGEKEAAERQQPTKPLSSHDSAFSRTL